MVFAIITCISNVVYADPEPGFRIYTATGGIYTDDETERMNIGSASGASVYARYNQFNKLLKAEEIVWDYSLREFYSCFGSDDSDETLTLGETFNYDYSGMSDIQKLKHQVSKQINYINSIGGTMTGYRIESSGSIFERYALNISWDVGGEHHYARFESDNASLVCIGYYDLCYSESGIVQYDIPYMNEHFGAVYDVQ